MGLLYSIIILIALAAFLSCGNKSDNSIAIKENSGEQVISMTAVKLEPSVAIRKGETRQLYASIEPSSATNQNVNWKTGNNTVAAVTGEGLVTAVSPGIASITVTAEDGGFQAVCEITVAICDEIMLKRATVESDASDDDTTGFTGAFNGNGHIPCNWLFVFQLQDK